MRFRERSTRARDSMPSFPEEASSKWPRDLSVCYRGRTVHIVFQRETEGKTKVNTGVAGPSPRAVSSLNKLIRSQFFGQSAHRSYVIRICTCIHSTSSENNLEAMCCESPEGTHLMVSPGRTAGFSFNFSEELSRRIFDLVSHCHPLHKATAVRLRCSFCPILDPPLDTCCTAMLHSDA